MKIRERRIELKRIDLSKLLQILDNLLACVFVLMRFLIYSIAVLIALLLLINEFLNRLRW